MISDSFEGILAIKLNHKLSEYSFVVVCTYLPPESSSWGKDCEAFFSHLMSIVYLTIHCDLLVICGDLNSRIGSKKDYIEGIDSVLPRINLDSVINGHGNVFIEFLQECNLCILNGRVTPGFDDYTFVSPRGKSVVDYFVVPHENIPLCSICKVETMTELLHKGNLFSKISEACKPSDHSVVTATFNVLLSNNASEVISDNEVPSVIFNRKIYNLQKDSNNLFNSDMFKNALMEVIEKLEAQIICQRTVDQNFELFANVILKELDQYLCLPQCTSGTRKRYKYSKPFWNEELTILWKTMRNSENTWKKCKGCEGLKRCLHNKFKLNQNIFDKRLKQIERNFNREIAKILGKNVKVLKD